MTGRQPRMILAALVLVGLLVPATAQARPPGGIAGVLATATATATAALALPDCLAPTSIQTIAELRNIDSITVAASDDLWVRGEPAKPGGASILHSDGHTWRDAAQGLPPGSRLTSIAAAGPDAVWGIGSMQAGNPLARVLVARWGGARWQQVLSPHPVPKHTTARCLSPTPATTPTYPSSPMTTSGSPPGRASARRWCCTGMASAGPPSRARTHSGTSRLPL